jgi:hypothetical protein
MNLFNGYTNSVVKKFQDKFVQPMDLHFDPSLLLAEYLRSRHIDNVPDYYDTWEAYNQGFHNHHIEYNAPYLQVVCKLLQPKLKFNYVLYRTIPPRTTLSWHTDQDCATWSYHIPLMTNSGCYFATEVSNYSLRNCGQMYKVNTQILHTFFNAGNEPRVHLHFIYDLQGRYTSGKFRR